MKFKIIKKISFVLLLVFFVSCKNRDVNIENNSENIISNNVDDIITNTEEDKTKNNSVIDDNKDPISNATGNIINVNFKLGKSKKYNNIVVEDTEKLKSKGKEHSVKYYSYIPISKIDGQNFTYYDVGNNERYMKVNDDVPKNNYKWTDSEGVMSKKPPIGHKMSYGIDISKHNGKINFEKVKKAGFDFVFIRIAYRGYGSAGNLKIDEMQEINLKNAKSAGLKVGAYVFAQSINKNDAVEEAKLAIDLLKDYHLDLPLVYDPETIKGDVARTDDVTGDEWTESAIAFCEEVKKAGFKPAIYSNMVWEDYYFDMEKLKDYEIWYADYNKIPQTPYNFKYWQFSEVGIVDGVNGEVDLNVMIW